MQKLNEQVFQKADALLGGNTLCNEAKAVLLLKMCHAALLFAPEKVDQYWEPLRKLQYCIPADYTAEFNEIKTVKEDSETTKEPGGFIAEIQNMLKKGREKLPADMEESKRIFVDCENAVKKRFWPAGKKKAWLLIIEAWLEIDRRESLRLLTNLSYEMKKNFILRLNKKFPLKPMEWSILENDQSVYRITEDLVDQAQELFFSDNVLCRTAQNIRSKMQDVSFTDEKIPIAHYEKYQKLLLKHLGKVSEDIILQLIEEMYKTIVTAKSLDNIWLTRFNLATYAINLLILCGIRVEETFWHRLLPATPPYMQVFARAYYIGRQSASIEAIKQLYDGLMLDTKNDYHAEAWFLMTLIKQGYGETALEYAKSSVNSNKLLPRLKRLAIFYKGTSGALVKPEDFGDSVLCQFLAQPSVEERVNYLIKVTNNGNAALPAEIWGKVDIYSMIMLSSHVDNDEFKEMNSLYASIYFKNTSKEKLFGEYLRLSGFGICRYGDVDTILIETLHEWSKKDARAVKDVFGKTWNFVRPDNSIFQVEVIYSAFLERCRNVFAVDPDFFTGEYLQWFKTLLVQQGIQWREGDMIRTIRFPETGPFNQALLGAMNIGVLSPDKKDAILRLAMEKYKLDDKGALFAAQSFGEGKEEVPFLPPVKLSAEHSSWQVGMVGIFFKKLLDQMFIEEPDDNDTEQGVKLPVQ